MPPADMNLDELGIRTQSLKQWKNYLAALPATGLGQQSAVKLKKVNRRLRGEVRRLAQQRDILKKLGILSTPKRQRFEPVKALSHEYQQRLAQAGVIPSSPSLHPATSTSE